MNDSYKFEVICKNIIIDYFNNNVEKTDNKKIGIKDVYVVWLCKTLKNSKALLSTNISDGMYYEITYNGEKDEIYLDAYKKWKNKLITSDKFNDKVELEENLHETIKEIKKDNVKINVELEPLDSNKIVEYIKEQNALQDEVSDEVKQETK